MDYRLLTGDVLDGLGEIAPGSVRCCVTSPPYWGLRDYGVEGQIGLEQTPDEYVQRLVEVFWVVRDLLADDGTLWLNLGDSYAADRSGTGMPAETLAGGIGGHGEGDALRGRGVRQNGNARRNCRQYGLKHKDLVGIPWRVAFALQSDGWYLRSDIIWHKPNPMPESVTDRPTKAHEYLFLLTKSAKYYYNAKAVAEPAVKGPQTMQANPETARRRSVGPMARGAEGFNHQYADSSRVWAADGTRNRRSVWTIPPKPFRGAHFAVMPEALVEPCILAGSAPGDTVLDPFAGSGTVGVVALRHGRQFVGCELNPEYIDIARKRIDDSSVAEAV
jgi:DNA modification methylase